MTDDKRIELEFKLTNVTTERDVAWKEIERLRNDGEPSNEQTIAMFNSQLAAANEEIERQGIEIAGQLELEKLLREKLTAANAKVKKLRGAADMPYWNDEQGHFIIDADDWIQLQQQALADTQEGD